ncbi:hypothetical protein NKE62_11125 [Akkermansia sp. Marseille-P9185]|uniref:hypothetical protein n=1 Tax=Akkermansia massiliensis TaxID=2927224 RepID=UPI00209BF1A5|nr:hypothetical protein [Akkermansia massiliensis]MCO8187474.1 hypothetical protein [Akkermansia massiliensis]
MSRVYVQEGEALKRGLREIGKSQRWLVERLKKKKEGKLSVCLNTMNRYCNDYPMPIEIWEEVRTHIIIPERNRQRKVRESKKNGVLLRKRGEELAKARKQREQEERRSNVKACLRRTKKTVSWLSCAITRSYNTVKGWLSGKKNIPDDAYFSIMHLLRKELEKLEEQEKKNICAYNRSCMEQKKPIELMLEADAYAVLEQEATYQSRRIEYVAAEILCSRLMEMAQRNRFFGSRKFR